MRAAVCGVVAPEVCRPAEAQLVRPAFQRLGDLPGGPFFSEAVDISADGSTVVGFADSTSGNEAFVWDTDHGIRALRDVLTDDLGLNVTGWTLDLAQGISDDGLTIVGRRINPSGFAEAWVATLPESGTLTMLGLGGLLVARRNTTGRRGRPRLNPSAQRSL